jgi:MFS family permease
MQKVFSKQNWAILILFGLIGQIAWSVENMYFNLFVFDTIAPDLDAITLMVQLSGVTATVTTLVAGTLSDKLGNRRRFISYGYLIWGLTVGLFGFLSVDTAKAIFSTDTTTAITLTLVAVIVGDCIMTVFGSTANDAAFNAWVTDNTEESYRGKVEGVLAVLPLFAMLIVAGGFGILVEAIGYQWLFLGLGVVISVCGAVGIFCIQDSPALEKKGTLKDIFYGFKPSVVKQNKPLYLSLCIMGIYGVACQIFMPYLIIYMKTFLSFSVIEYSAVFALAILLGGAVNVYLTRISDKMDKIKMLYFAVGIFAAGLLGMYFSKGMGHTANLILFGVFGFVMITGNILVAALTGSTVRDHTPEGSVGKLQGVRMVFSVLLPMLFGPMIGDALNTARGLGAASENAALTTAVIPAPEIFLAGALFSLLMFVVLPMLKEKKNASENEI